MIRSIGSLLASFAILCGPVGPSLAGAPQASTAGWQVERDVETPSYALIEPTESELNIDSVVLLCEQGHDRPILQLRLYLSGSGPLAPLAASALQADATLELAIDGTRHPVQLLFADDFVVVADAAEGLVPLASTRLLDALQAGRRMELRFRFVEVTGVGGAQRRGRVLDAIALVDLQAGRGGAAVAAVRRCAGQVDPRLAQTASRKPHALH